MSGAAWLGQRYSRSGWGGHCDTCGRRSCLFVSNDKNYMCMYLCIMSTRRFILGVSFFGEIRLAEIEYSVYHSVIFFFPGDHRITERPLLTDRAKQSVTSARDLTV